MVLNDLAELPRINSYVKNLFVIAVKRHHEGAKWRVLKEEIEKAFLFYIEKGPLSDEYIQGDLTTGDVERNKLTTSNFFKMFDNEHIYPYDKIEVEYLKQIVSKITGNKSDYKWRKWSKIIKQSGRLRQLKGTCYYLVIRDKFEFIDQDLKASYDATIKERPLESYNTMENHANRIYKKLIPGQIINLHKFCKIGRIPENEGKKAIKKLESEHKLQFINYGKWRVLDLTTTENLKEKSLISTDG